jgi:hypothetical protein
MGVDEAAAVLRFGEESSRDESYWAGRRLLWLDDEPARTSVEEPG